MDQPDIALRPAILVAPLDWGLGHATRCIPVIQALLEQNCSVLLAGEGQIMSLLLSEFPHLKFLHLKGYRVSYATNKWALPLRLVSQIPQMLFAIKEEHTWLQKVVKEYKIDAVIADNRYGLHHPSIASVFITHQLRIKTPLGKKANDFLQKINYRFINRFSECWVPDAATQNNLAAQLSHPLQMPAVPVKYTGPLSRFTSSDSKIKKHILILLSGPEPQRTILEKILLQQIGELNKPVLFVRGLPGNEVELKSSANVIFYNHLDARTLQEKFYEATMVISRCGYSTVMDLAALKIKSILIPTPGQTEQEYLARHLMKENFALCIAQNKFNLIQALETASIFKYSMQSFDGENFLQQTITGFINRLVIKRKNNNTLAKTPA